MNTELVPRESAGALLESPDIEGMVTRAKQALERANDVHEIKIVLDHADAAEHYYKKLVGRVRWARDAYRETAKVRLLAEREIGALRHELPDNRGRERKFDWDEARSLHESGLSLGAIARRLGVSSGSVSGAKKNNWEKSAKDASASAIRDAFDEGIGLSRTSAVVWQKLSRIPVETLERLVDEACAADAGLGARAILIRAGLDTPYDQRASHYKSAARRRARAEATRAIQLQERLTSASKRGDAIGRSYTLLRTKTFPDLQAAYDALPVGADLKNALGKCLSSAYVFEESLYVAMMVPAADTS